MRPAAQQQHAQQQHTRPAQGFLLKPHQRLQRQFQQQQQQQQLQAQQEDLQQQSPEAPYIRQMTQQEQRDASFAAAGVRPKVPMKVSHFNLTYFPHHMF